MSAPLSPLLFAPAAILAALTTFVLTGFARRYAVRRGVLDHPSDRSSHAIPTPRGGGIALAALLIPFAIVAGMTGWIDTNVSIALSVGGSLITAVGWLDDHRSLGRFTRFAVHAICAALAVFLIGGPEELSSGRVHIELGVAGDIAAWLGIVWLVNLYNFMDGIDGIASAEAVVVGGVGGGLLLAGGVPSLALVCFVIAGAAAGFIVWNWAPAKIFMGDAGSGLLGYCLAVVGLAADRSGAVGLLVWLALLAVFVVDATVTLVRRLLRHERVFDAHRSHAYQRMVQSGWSHARVTTAVIVLNLACAGAALVMFSYPSTAPLVAATLIAMLGAAYLIVESRVPMQRTRDAD